MLWCLFRCAAHFRRRARFLPLPALVVRAEGLVPRVSAESVAEVPLSEGVVEAGLVSPPGCFGDAGTLSLPVAVAAGLAVPDALMAPVGAEAVACVGGGLPADAPAAPPGDVAGMVDASRSVWAVAAGAVGAEWVPAADAVA